MYDSYVHNINCLCHFHGKEKRVELRIKNNYKSDSYDAVIQLIYSSIYFIAYTVKII